MGFISVISMRFAQLKKLLLGGCLLAVLLLLIINLSVIRYERYTSDQLTDLPDSYACLVLGTSPWLGNGQENLFYAYRMEAAYRAYHAGKCHKLVLSGDNRQREYNEPEMMKRSLLAMGIPVENLVCDYAGARTLDSVIRFNAIFGQAAGIVISQPFHNARAIYIARHNGITLVGYNAEEVDFYDSLRTRVREIFSRVLAVLDVMLFKTEPRHYGEKIII